MVIGVGITEEKKEKRFLQEITQKNSDKRQLMYLKL